MGKVKQFYTDVQAILYIMYASIGMDKPLNHEDILSFVANDVMETADPVNWSNGDVAIAFRRWLESKSNVEQTDDYFQIVRKGYDKELQREEVQIHGGYHANIMLIKTDEGFVIDVYGESDHIDSLTIWEDQLDPADPDELDNTDISDADIKKFKEDWGQTHSGVTAELGYPRSHEQSDGLLMDDYFWIEKDKKWYNKHASMFTEKEQRIADHLRNQ